MSTRVDCVLIVWCCVPSDYRRSGGDAAEGEGAGRGPEETGPDPTAAEQVPAIGAAGRPGLVRLLTLSGVGWGCWGTLAAAEEFNLLDLS